jgi:hypothetical protein
MLAKAWFLRLNEADTLIRWNARITLGQEVVDNLIKRPDIGGHYYFFMLRIIKYGLSHYYFFILPVVNKSVVYQKVNFTLTPVILFQLLRYNFSINQNHFR